MRDKSVVNAHGKEETKKQKYAQQENNSENMIRHGRVISPSDSSLRVWHVSNLHSLDSVVGEVGQPRDLLHLDSPSLGCLDTLDDAGQFPALVDHNRLQPRPSGGDGGRALFLGCRRQHRLADWSLTLVAHRLLLHLVRAVSLDNLLPIVAVKLIFQSSATG